MDVLQMAQDLVLFPIRDTAVLVLRFLPNVGMAALIMLLGYPLAVLAREVTARLLRAVGLDVLSDKTGFTRLLEKGGIRGRPSRALGLLAYWVIIFSALILVFDVLQIPAGARLIEQVLALVPKLLAVLVILSLGMLLGRFVGRIVETSSLIANVPFAAAMGRLTWFAVVGIAFVAALRFVDFVPPALTGTLAAISIGAPAVVAVAVLLGSPRTFSSIVAGRFLRDQIKPGDIISFDGITGQVHSVQLVSTRLQDGTDEIIVANADLAATIIRRSAAKSTTETQRRVPATDPAAAMPGRRGRGGVARRRT